MTCREFQYEEGKEYEEKDVCKPGFHACEYPLDCFRYYSPNESVYHEVEQSGDISKSKDNKEIISAKIKIGKRLSIAGLAKAAVEYIKEKTGLETSSNENGSVSSATDNFSVSFTTGNHSASSAAGHCSVSSAAGDKSASSATGNVSASSATGNGSVSSVTGSCSASFAAGNCSVSSATGYRGSSSVTGNYSVSSTTGCRGASSAESPCSVAVAWGCWGKAKGVIGSFLVLADFADTDDWKVKKIPLWKQEEWKFKGAKMVQVDGEKIKEDTWYTMVNGEIVEAGD